MKAIPEHLWLANRFLFGAAIMEKAGAFDASPSIRSSASRHPRFTGELYYVVRMAATL